MVSSRQSRARNASTVIPLRERLHDGLDMVAVWGPMTSDVVGGLELAVADHVRSPRGAALRRGRRSPSSPWRGTLSAAAVDRALGLVVRRHEPGLEPIELATRAHGDGYGGLPISLHVSGHLIAGAVPHDLFDGTGAREHIHAIFASAAGTVPSRSPAETPSFPVLRALRRQGLATRTALVAARTERRAAERESATGPLVESDLFIDPERRRGGLRVLELPGDVDEAARGDRTHGHATRGSRLTALVVDAVARSVRLEGDLTLRYAIDLRRYLGPGVGAEGPFATAYPLGTVRSGENSPEALAARLRRAVSSGAPLAALIGNLAAAARRDVRHPLASPTMPTGRDRVALVISMVPDTLPPIAWRHDGPLLSAALQFHPWQVTDPLVQITDRREAVTVSIWDETGVIDLDEAVARLAALAGAEGRTLPKEGSA